MSFRSVKQGLAAFLLSILTPGLGQIYNGQLWKGAFCFGGLLGFALASRVVGLTHSRAGLIAYVIFALSIYLFIIGEAIYTAVRQVRVVHNWCSYVMGLSLFLINVVAVRGNVPDIRAYRIPAESMLPTLASGDRIVTDNRYYRSHTPRRGDLIVFEFPYLDHPPYIKRIIGIPGDHIKIVDKQVYLNGQRQGEPYVRHDSAALYDPFLYNFPPAGHDELTSSMQPEWADQIFKYVQNGELVVPPGSYFTLGDNREHSWDSRYWGFVAGNKIFSKALFLYWSNDRSRIGQTIR